MEVRDSLSLLTLSIDDRYLKLRELVEMTYKPPQVPDVEVMQAVVIRHGFDFRRVFVEHPRVRMDGVYIAVCHYVYVHCMPGFSAEEIIYEMNLAAQELAKMSG
jgi:hypothetical protein